MATKVRAMTFKSREYGRGRDRERKMDVVLDLDVQIDISREKYQREEEAISVPKFVANPWMNVPPSK